ncbi:cutinase family protein [Rhodococcus triatomae]|uniref:Cutinase n=1 Tax=Rhodococcus triatomae TaxID=300028 RepID=A0A1G8HNF9_9NOCA|nr:cutinase family protein [Rhodococcus triatomae]QNG20835.1 cutinase family protein [Rhodococcus triatomae]QNG23250.1 cutinase family protein [Rhodococcus triatomae]SDI08155.1 Cutinase [Rhodococcus triatomae]
MKRVAALLSAAVAATVLPLVAAPAVQADPSCPSLHVVAVPGTWETSTKPDARPVPGMLSAVTGGLPKSVRADYVTYAATAFPWEGEVYGRSKKQAVDHARGMIGDMAAACPGTDMALIGYSQGADAAGDLAAEIGTGLGVVPPEKLVGVGLISDPRRAESDTLIGPHVPGNGASGPRIGGFGWVGHNTVTFCAAGDLYCSTEKDDFVTRLAGFMAQTSGSPAAAVGAFRGDALALWGDLAAAGGLPALMIQLDENANRERVEQLRSFYGSQVHQDYSTYVVDSSGNTALTWLRGWLRDKA